MVLKGKRGNNHTQQQKTHSTARQRGTTRQHSTVEHSRAQQDTTARHTTQQGSLTVPTKHHL